MEPRFRVSFFTLSLLQSLFCWCKGSAFFLNSCHKVVTKWWKKGIFWRISSSMVWCLDVRQGDLACHAKYVSLVRVLAVLWYQCQQVENSQWGYILPFQGTYYYYVMYLFMSVEEMAIIQKYTAFWWRVKNVLSFKKSSLIKICRNLHLVIFSGYSFARIIIFCIFAPKKGVFKQ